MAQRERAGERAFGAGARKSTRALTNSGFSTDAGTLVAKALGDSARRASEDGQASRRSVTVGRSTGSPNASEVGSFFGAQRLAPISAGVERLEQDRGSVKGP